MTICRKCGTSNNDDRKFCSFCNELLVADPKELAAREKKLIKAQKKELKKRKRQKRALFLLIPIGILDFWDLLCCLDLLFLGIADRLGGFLGRMLAGMLGQIIHLFGFPVYTVDFVTIVLRSLEFLSALGCFAAACVLCVVMVVRMIKWHRYKKLHGDVLPEVSVEHEGVAEQAQSFATPVETVMPKGELMEQDVSYEALVQTQESKSDYVMPAPVAEADCKELYEQMLTALGQYDAPSVRSVLSAMAASRLLVCDAGAMHGANAFDDVCQAFGVKAEQAVVRADASSLSELLLQKNEESGVTTHTPYAKALYTARFSPKNICFAGVYGVDAQHLGDVYAPLCDYYRLPGEGLGVYLGKPAAPETPHRKKKVAAPVLPEGIADGVLTLSGNLWMMGVLPGEFTASALPADIAQYCAVVYLHRAKNKSTPDDGQEPRVQLPSVAAFEAAVSTAEQSFYLSEDSWKAIDELEAMMQSECGKRFSNRILRALEKYTSVYLACGGKQNEALDNGLVSLILPAYSAEMATLAKRNEGETPMRMLERTVGRDRLPLTAQALGKMVRN